MTAKPTAAARDPILVAFCGTARSGKTTAAAYLAEHYGFEAVNFADALKDILEAHLTERGIDHAWLHEPQLKEQPIPQLGVSARHMMQTLGDWGRNLHPNWWVNALADRTGLPRSWCSGLAEHDLLPSPVHDRIVIADMRYPNEARWVHAQGGMLIHLLRHQADPVSAHSSEQHAHDLGAQVTLVNDGNHLAGLHQMLDVAMASLGIEPRDDSRQPLRFEVKQ